MRQLMGAALLPLLLVSCAGTDSQKTAGIESRKKAATGQDGRDRAAGERARRLASPSIVNLVGFRLDTASNEMVPVTGGSAVAVGTDRFLTDCRNLIGADAVALAKSGKVGIAYLDQGYYGEDVCVLRSEEIVGTPVLAVRSFAEIGTGEPVYAVADPRGRGTAFKQGVVATKRQDPGGAWLQTTAAFGQGWSGGGLFDQQGNLLGVTASPRDGQQQLAALNVTAPFVPETMAGADTDRAMLAATITPGAGPVASSSAPAAPSARPIGRAWSDSLPSGTAAMTGRVR